MFNYQRVDICKTPSGAVDGGFLKFSILGPPGGFRGDVQRDVRCSVASRSCDVGRFQIQTTTHLRMGQFLVMWNCSIQFNLAPKFVEVSATEWQYHSDCAPKVSGLFW